MLLKRCALRVHERSSDDRGSALVAVLGVMVVGLILTTLITSSVINAYAFSSSTRAGVQAHAAADAGIAAARAGLYQSTSCSTQPIPGTYSATGNTAYTAVVQHDSGSGWQPGCPDLNSTRVRILSTGQASARGVAGATSGNTRQVEAVFTWLTPGPRPSGAAIDLYEGGQVEANSSFDLSESSGLIVQNGNLDCSKNNSMINGDLLVTGNLTFTGTCSVNGNATVSGTATLGSGSILGNLTAASVSPNPPGTHVTGTYTQSAAVAATPPWADIPYNPDQWLTATGAKYTVMTPPTGVTCALPNGSLGGTGGTPIIIDMRACPGGPTASNNTTVSLTSDVVIFANQFNFGGINSLTFTSGNGSLHRLWLITPDNTPDHQPTCDRAAAAPSTQGDFVVKNNYTVSDVFATTITIQAMLYTPCAFVAKNGFTWNGQIYAGQYSYVQNNPTFTYAPIGVAGFSLDTGNPVPLITSPQPGSPISNRDLAGG